MGKFYTVIYSLELDDFLILRTSIKFSLTSFQMRFHNLKFKSSYVYINELQLEKTKVSTTFKNDFSEVDKDTKALLRKMFKEMENE